MLLWIRRYLVPALIAAAVFVIALGAGYALKEQGSGPKTPVAASDSTLASRGTVQSFDGTTLRLTTTQGIAEFRVGSGTPVEALRPVPASSMTVGDWLNAGVIPNNQSVFTLTAITLIAVNLLEAR